MKKLYFATTNDHKFEEARLLMVGYGIKLKQLKTKAIEIQSENLEEISKECAIQVVAKNPLPVIVEDAGLFIEALNGFPGPFSSYVYKTIGTQGVLRLMRGIKNRNALFLSAVAFCKPKSDPQVFVGKVDGVITLKERGGYGFGFDPIFQPKGKKKTFAEMRRGEKNKFSHRAKALRNFAEWFNKKI